MKQMPQAERPHYGPEQRFRILRIRSFLGLSQRETAAMFRVSVETIVRWEMEAMSPDGDDPTPRPHRRSEPSRPAFREHRQGRGQDDGAGRIRRERPDRTDGGPRG